MSKWIVFAFGLLACGGPVPLFVTPSLAKGPNTMNGSTYEYRLEWEGETIRIERVSQVESERRVTVLRRVE